MTLENVINAINLTDASVRAIIDAGGRERIANERYLHHMFSSFYRETIPDFDWQNLPLLPEFKTNFQFLRKHVDINNPESTRENAIGVGTSGNLDFLIPGDPNIAIEWKGPVNCPEQDIAEAMLKLLGRDPTEVRIYAAIYTTKAGNRNHCDKLINKITRSIEFAADTFEITEIDENFHLYVKSHFEGGWHELCWGPHTGLST